MADGSHERHHSDKLLDEKRALRRAMAERRQGLSPDDRARWSAAAAAKLGGLPELAAPAIAGRTVSGYLALAMKGEIDPAPALVASRARGAEVALPRVSATPPRLRFHRAAADGSALLAAGRFGLVEPDAGSPEIPVERIDVMILPGLAFDRAGRRLGWGGGYYDEAAGRLRASGRGFLVGVAYDFQLVDRCPADPAGGDVPVDCVVTDRQVVRCQREGAGS